MFACVRARVCVRESESNAALSAPKLRLSPLRCRAHHKSPPSHSTRSAAYTVATVHSFRHSLRTALTTVLHNNIHPYDFTINTHVESKSTRARTHARNKKKNPTSLSRSLCHSEANKAQFYLQMLTSEGRSVCGASCVKNRDDEEEEDGDEEGKTRKHPVL